MSESRLKRALDGVATVSITLTCGVAIWLMIDGRVRPSGGSEANRVRAAEPPLPAIPITLDGAALKGSPSAKVAVVVYSDFQCPFCGKFAREALPSIEKKYIESGKVLLAFRQFPLSSIHSYAEKAAEATLCAGRQGKFWEMHDLFFRDQSMLKEEGAFANAGAVLGLNMPQYTECLAGPAAEIVSRDKESGKDLRITGTPTFFLGTVQKDGRVKVTNRLAGAMPAERFETILDELTGSAIHTP